MKAIFAIIVCTVLGGFMLSSVLTPFKGAADKLTATLKR